MPGLTYTTSPNLELVKTALDELRDYTLLRPAERGKASADHPIVFNQSQADKAAVVTTLMGGGGYMKKTITGQAQDVTAKKTAAKSAPSPKTTIIAEFNADIPISRSFMMDQQHDAVSKAVRQETQVWIASRDRNAFLFFANGTGTTLSTTIDGVALFSNSHVNANGDTVDNLETGAITDSTLNSSVVSLRGQVNQTGVKVGYEPAFLLTSSTNHHDSMIVSKSVLKAGSGSNDLNYYSELYPGMQVLFNQFIDDVSTTMYVIGAENHGVSRFVREGLTSELVDWKYDENHMYKYRFVSREEVDTISYDGLVGSTGA